MKVVTVHRGSRDGYQVARALQEAGMLDALVTDLYWPADQAWAQYVERMAPRRLLEAFRRRYADQLPSHLVEQCWGSGLSSLATSKAAWLPFDCERRAVRWCDWTLGRHAGRIATERRAALLSYSYYAHSAFSHYAGDQPRILFQLHPHPSSVRKILQRERISHPDCAASLDKEWELALPEEDFNRLVEEAGMAEYWLVASNFTKRTLVEAGISSDRIAVIPYGVDLKRFVPRRTARPKNQPLNLLFVGTLCQRKGLKYLMQALDLLPAQSVELTVCGRAVDSLALFQGSRTQIHLHESISAEGLLQAYQAADVFVFPSLAEGFGQVLLEAMASGLPIISTTRTAAPDLIRHGKEGLIIEPGNASELAAAIEKLLESPDGIRQMGDAARRRAEYFTRERFREGVAGVVADILTGSEHSITTSCLPF